MRQKPEKPLFVVIPAFVAHSWPRVSFWTSWLPFGRVRTPAAARAEALATAKIEDLSLPSDITTLVIKGQQTKGALPLISDLVDAAVYSSRGRGYANYNEDAGGIAKDESGRVYAFALDQAGGLGGRVRGEASGLAAEKIFRACQRIATDDPGDAIDPTTLLLDAFLDAHRTLIDREEGEVTTAIAAVLQADKVLLLNSGDSGALHFNADGQLKARTEMQEFPPPNDGCLRHALGLEPEGCEPTPYQWPLEPGDWVLLASDGLLDSGLSERAMGEILAGAETAEDGVNEICTTVLRRMGTMRAKPDNLTVVAAHRRAV